MSLWRRYVLITVLLFVGAWLISMVVQSLSTAMALLGAVAVLIAFTYPALFYHKYAVARGHDLLANLRDGRPRQFANDLIPDIFRGHEGCCNHRCGALWMIIISGVMIPVLFGSTIYTMAKPQHTAAPTPCE